VGLKKEEAVCIDQLEKQLDSLEKENKI